MLEYTIVETGQLLHLHGQSLQNMERLPNKGSKIMNARPHSRNKNVDYIVFGALLNLIEAPTAPTTSSLEHTLLRSFEIAEDPQKPDPRRQAWHFGCTGLNCVAFSYRQILTSKFLPTDSYQLIFTDIFRPQRLHTSRFLPTTSYQQILTKKSYRLLLSTYSYQLILTGNFLPTDS